MPVSEVAEKLRELGLESGWGSNVGRIRSTMLMLGDIIQAPDPETLQASLHLPSFPCPASPAPVLSLHVLCLSWQHHIPFALGQLQY